MYFGSSTGWLHTLPYLHQKVYFQLKADTEYINLVVDLFVFQVSYIVPFVQCYSKCHFYNYRPSKARGFFFFHINPPNISLIIIYLTSYIFNHVLRHPLPLLPPLSCIVRMPFAPSKCAFWLCVTPSPILPCSPTPKPQQWDTNAQQKLLVLGSCPMHFATPLCHYE